MVVGAVYQRQSQVPVNPLRSGLVGGGITTPGPTMRYYRLWIYTCNVLLLLSVVGFSLAAARVLVLDPRRDLVPGLGLSQPAFLYAAAALAFQSGFLQLVGCIAAQRLNERLLNLYWLLLLALLVGDIVLGIFWLFRFDRILGELKPYLRTSLSLKYGVDPYFTILWDGLQSHSKCCGVHGYQDYYTYNLTQTSPGGDGVSLPASCCRPPSGTVVVVGGGHQKGHGGPASPTSSEEAVSASQPRCTPDTLPHQQPCYPHLYAWLTQTAHLLFVIGYCVIAFIKLSFLGILRYEIKEMIQKIKLVQESAVSGSQNGPGCPIGGGRPDLVDKLAVKQTNGAIGQQPNILGKLGDGESPGRGRHLTTLITQDATDSDTNSHCALILCEEGGFKPQIDSTGTNTNTNGNNNYEMSERHRHT